MLNTILLADALTRDDLVGLEEQIIPRFAGRTLGELISGQHTYGAWSVSSAMFWIAGTLLLIYLVLGGYKLMTSAGDPKKAAGARQTITNAFLGMLVVFIAYWIVQIVIAMLGLNDQGLFQ